MELKEVLKKYSNCTTDPFGVCTVHNLKMGREFKICSKSEKKFIDIIERSFEPTEKAETSFTVYPKISAEKGLKSIFALREKLAEINEIVEKKETFYRKIKAAADKDFENGVPAHMDITDQWLHDMVMKYDVNPDDVSLGNLLEDF